MIYEVIGKIVLYIIGTLLFGALFGAIEDDMGDSETFFFGAWTASIVVFSILIIQSTQ